MFFLHRRKNQRDSSLHPFSVERRTKYTKRLFRCRPVPAFLHGRKNQRDSPLLPFVCGKTNKIHKTAIPLQAGACLSPREKEPKRLYASSLCLWKNEPKRQFASSLFCERRIKEANRYITIYLSNYFYRCRALPTAAGRCLPLPACGAFRHTRRGCISRPFFPISQNARPAFRLFRGWRRRSKG